MYSCKNRKHYHVLIMLNSVSFYIDSEEPFQKSFFEFSILVIMIFVVA